MRQAWFKREKLPDINHLVRSTQNLSCFANLHNTKTAKQTVRKVLTDWTNFKKSISAYKKDRSQFINRPKPPHYKNKLAQVIFYNETIKKQPAKNGVVSPTNGCFQIPSTRTFKQVVITPKTFGFILEVQYDVDIQKAKVSKDKVCSIDIGLNNLCAITSDQHSPILVNGRIVKSFNQWFNKNPCKSRSKKRYFRIENYFHHVSKMIVQNCVKYQIGTIIIGRNEGWKTNINLGKKTNQQFSYVPFYKLIQKIQYKAQLVGIDVILVDEAYTSKCSYLDKDPLDGTIVNGTRVKRGLYQSKTGMLINADVNGSANICRKHVIQNADLFSRLDRSLAARPVIVDPCESLSCLNMSQMVNSTN